MFELGGDGHHRPTRENSGRVGFVVGDPFSIHDIEFAQDGVGANVIELVAERDGTGRAGHLRRKVTDIDQHIVSGIAPLQHRVVALQIFDPAARFIEPGRVAVERGSESRILSRHPAGTRLVDIDVQHEVVNSSSKYDITRSFAEVGMMVQADHAGKCLGIGPPFSVKMRNRTGSTAILVALVLRRAFGPKLATDLIGVTAVHGEVAGETGVPVGFAPQHQIVFVGGIPKAGQIVFRNQIGHRSAQIPQELIRGFRAIDYGPREYGQEFDRAVSVAFLKFCSKSVCPVLRSGFIAVDCNALESGLFFRPHLL